MLSKGFFKIIKKEVLYLANKKEKKPRKSNGSGSFKKRADGSWEYQVCYDRDMNGKVIRKSFYGKTQAECRDKQKAYEIKNTIPIEKVLTVAEWSRRWLELYKKDKCSVNMYEQYEHIVEKYIIPNIGYFKLATVKPAHIVEMMNKYTNKSDSFIKKIMLSLRSIFETAIDNDFCVKNPAKNVKAEGKKQEEKEFFNEKEVATIEKFCFEERSNISDALITLLYTGLRREELLGLKWSDINFEEKTITLNRVIIIESGTPIIKDTLKNDYSKRVIPILPPLDIILNEKERISEFVFPIQAGNFQSPNGFSTTYKRLIKRINRTNDKNNQIRELSPHSCRHTFASHLSKNGVDIKIIQSLLGHADIAMTGNVYTHPTIAGLKKALDGFKY